VDRFLAISVLGLLLLGLVFIAVPDGGVAILVVILFSAATLFVIRRFTQEKEFITNIFLSALCVRLVFGIVLHIFELRDFFGGDALTYDFLGNRLAEVWSGLPVPNDFLTFRALSTSGSGWGMNYFVGALYFITGRNIFAAQSLCAVVGAATAPMVYFCALKLFDNKNVGKMSAIVVAVFPSFVIWSGQLLKDGLIIFLLVLAMTMVMQLQERFSYLAVSVLVLAVFGILSLRFYIFYVVFVAVVGSFLIGVSNSAQSILRRTIVLVLIGVGLTYFGVGRTASEDFDRYGTLEQLRNSREDLAQSGASGFGQDVDVSTSEGAVAILPIGFAYLMLAPFPWQVTNFRQFITLPEVLAWWAMIPFLVYGLWFTIRTRLRPAFPILIFSLMLTLAYSIFQGNFGTAYRQRTQIQVFLIMFVAVGWKLYKERKEDKRVITMARQRRLEEALQARMRF
jgi:4-amino-4-deoxy-L-arabinose transferase-like glycosyltransferase